MDQDNGDRPRSRNVTLKDVAQLAGVSIATASKALNGRDQVHPETRNRVLDVAKRISFVPNSLAQGLLAGQTRTVGLLTNDLVGRFSIPVLMGAEDAFGTGKISVLLCDARGDSIRETYHLDALIGRRVDGLIVVGSSTDVRPSLGSLPIPVVYAYAPSDDPRDLSLVPDNAGAGALAVKHLLETGRTRIAHITGEEGFLAARDRADGVVAAMKAAGLNLVGDEVRYGNWTESWGRAATRTLLDQHPEVDAVLCGSDQIARGALDAIREANRSVPEDIAVAGFDNWDVVVTGARPQLTSVDMDLESLGRTAAERLFAAMGGSNHAGTESLPCRLVVRGSTVPES
jgi:LacI family transcriptional regulator